MTISAEVALAPAPAAASGTTEVRSTATKRRLPLSAKIAGVVIVIIVLAAIFAPFITSTARPEGSLTNRLKPIGSLRAPARNGWAGPRHPDPAAVRRAAVPADRPDPGRGVRDHRHHPRADRRHGPQDHPRHRSCAPWTSSTPSPRCCSAIAIAAALGSGISNSIIALAVILIPPVARVAEAEVGRLRSADFIEAAHASGAGQDVHRVAAGVAQHCAGRGRLLHRTDRVVDRVRGRLELPRPRHLAAGPGVGADDQRSAAVHLHQSAAVVGAGDRDP